MHIVAKTTIIVCSPRAGWYSTAKKDLVVQNWDFLATHCQLPGSQVKMTVKDVKSGGYGNGQHRWSRRWDVIIVPACRLVIVTVIICAFIWRQDIDASVDEVYQVLRSSWLFQHESFEVCGSFIALVERLTFDSSNHSIVSNLNMYQSVR